MPEPITLTRQEAAYIRAEMLPRFGVMPKISDGIQLKSWKSGPLSGRPRLPSAVSSLVDRGLMEVLQSNPPQPSRAYFTALGINALTAAVRNGRVFPPDRYGHLLLELVGYADQPTI